MLKNTVILLLAAALAGEYWHASRTITNAQSQNAALRNQNTQLERRVRQIEAQRDQAVAKAASPIAPAAPAATIEGADPMELRMAGILDRIQLLKGWLDRHPAGRIGEFAHLTDDDWMATGRRFEKLDTDEDFRKAAADLRYRAEFDFMQGPLLKALKAYTTTSGGTLPLDIGQLAGYLDPSVDPSLLGHYVMIASGSSQSTANMPIYALNPQSAIVDEAYDTTMVGVGPGGSWSQGGNGSLAFLLDEMQARNAYRLANSGFQPQTPDQIAPYFQNPQFRAQFLAGLKARK
jgi:hypothetical protein